MEEIRIGNIGVIYKGDFKHKYEIVCWYPNPNYGRESEYNWTDDGEWAYKESIHCRTHKSCFKSKESCYVIAFVEEHDDEEPDIISVGGRFLRLNGEDFENYIEVCKLIFKNE